MYDNIGDKIKTVAVVSCVLGIIASVIWGVVTMFASFLVGLLVIVVGCLCSWLGTLTFFGFGELIEETQCNRAVNEKLLAVLESKQAETAVQKTKQETATVQCTGAKPVAAWNTGWQCKHCGSENKAGNVFCQNCGEYFK